MKDTQPAQPQDGTPGTGDIPQQPAGTPEEITASGGITLKHLGAHDGG